MSTPERPAPRSSLTFSERVKLMYANQHLITLEMLRPYAGGWVAIRDDYTGIVAGGKDIDELHDRLAELGIAPDDVWLRSVPGPEYDTYLGAGEIEWD